ncbi:2479_t:CDS:2, partial [Cetraspora pellucida]
MEVYVDDEEEYIPFLTTRRHYLDHPESDNEEEEEKMELSTGGVRTKKRKSSENKRELPLPPSDFEPFVHQRPLHRAFVQLPSHLDASASVIGRQWLDLSHKELIIWIALVIYQGLYRLPSLDQYWNEDEKLPLHHISKQMSLKCFEIIKRFLHISSPAATINNYFEKLEPLLSHIRNVSKQLYVPNSNVSVDEMVIRFSGRSIHIIRIKNKPTPEGFKILSLCESGYTYTFLLTSRVSLNNVTKVYGLSKTGCLVYHLVEQLPYSGFSFNIYMDNYFTSIPLFQYLRQINIGACGTIRKTSSGFPKELKVDKNIKFNWDIRSGIITNSALVVFWQDNGPVTMLTTIHGLVGDEWKVERERQRPRETSTNAVKVRTVFGTESKKKLKIPRVIDDYNNYMNGVDVADQLRSYYSMQQTTRRNWMPLFFWLLDTAIINTYRIIITSGLTKEHKEF